MKHRLAVMIMAAGKSRRFGGCKQLASLGEDTILQRIVDVANSRFANHVYVITGYFHDEIVSQTRSAQFLYNPDWSEGLGNSIAHGISHLADGYDGILLILGDQVAIQPGHIDAIVGGFNNRQIVCAHYCGTNGVPAIFPRHYFTNLMYLSGDKGAKDMLNQKSIAVKSIAIPEAAIDIDTRENLVLFNGQEENACCMNP